MTAHHTSRLIAGAALLALVASFLAPFPALAEESPPPAEPTAEATLPPDVVAPEAETMPEAEATPVPTEAPPAEGELPLTDEPAPVEAPAAEPDPAGLIEAVPDGTTVAVVGEDGALLPLASDEAATVIAEGDPVWCPASVKAPTPNLNGCTDSYDRFSLLLAALPSVVPTDGIIWIAHDYNSSLDGAMVEISGLTLPNLRSFKLTLRGGWDGAPGSKITDPLHPSTFSGTRLYIHDWANDVTLSDIVVTGVGATDALEIRTQGNITLQRVDASDNTGRGARLDNATGLPNTIAIIDSQFNENTGNGGLYAVSTGLITLANVTAGYYDELTSTSHGNTGYGVYLDNTAGTAGVTLTGINTFSANGRTGLTVYSRGPITASDLTAARNGTSGTEYGVRLDNDTSDTAAGVTLTGTNMFTSNRSGGLYVRTLGPIKVNNLDAHSSVLGFGADLYNAGAATAQPVTLTGTNAFKYNATFGLVVASAGAVTLNNVTASGNVNGRGVEIDNTYSASAAAVTFTGANAFHDNYLDGLMVMSLGAIKAANLSASANGTLSSTGYGIRLNNMNASTPLPITLTGKTSAIGNYQDGIYLQSRGPVSLQNVTANDSLDGLGLNVDNAADTASPQKVTLSGTNAFLGNYNLGLNIHTYGAVTLSNLTASGNGTGPSGGGAYISNGGSATAQKVALTGVNVFRDNHNYGLSIYATGAIAASSLTATGNGGVGAALDNTGATAAQMISLTGKNVLSDNGGDGLDVYSLGAVSLQNVTTEGNASSGLILNNTFGLNTSPQKVTFSGIHSFSNNGHSGAQVFSYGSITLSTAIASGNASGYGAYLVNSGSATPQPVTLSGSYTFAGNSVNGLRVWSLGAIKAANLTASDNQSTGAYLINSGGSAQPVTLSGASRFEGNAADGLYIESYGAITLSSLTASRNGTPGSASGAQIFNSSASSPQKVTLSGTNLFNENSYSGLMINSLGAVTLSSLTACGNGTAGSGYGVMVDNAETNAVGGVTLSGASFFNDNANTGLEVSSYGPIALNTTRLEADRNGASGFWGSGASLYNYYDPAPAVPPGVTLKGVSSFSENHDQGLFVSTHGPISLNSVSASGNGGNGATLDNRMPGSKGGITVGGTNVFDENGYTGLTAQSAGAITVSNLTASENGQSAIYGYGASLDNTYADAAAVQPIKLLGYGRFLGNLSQGLASISMGAITAANLTASGNDSDGVYLTNNLLGAIGGVTLSGTNTFKANDRMGLSIESRGAVTLSNLTASGNGTGGTGTGALIVNSSALTPQAVKLTGYGTFNDNAGGGLTVSSLGAITAANLTARNNGLFNGVALENAAGTAGITLTGTNLFTGNGENGLFISSLGPVTLTKVTADDNTLSGLFVSYADSLTLTCGSFTANGIYGLYVNPSDPMLIGVFASGNPSGDLIWSGGTITGIVRACPLP